MLELLEGIKWIGIYFGLCATVAIVMRLTVRIPDEIFRKILHCILLGSLSVWVMVFPKWWMAALTAVAFAVLVYPILYFAEHLKGYSKIVTERKQGELKASLLVVFAMFSIVVGVCWGIFRDRYLVIASIYAWGFGDAAAALVGKAFGRHKFSMRIAGGRKSIEGTSAMLLVSLISVYIILTLRGGLNWDICLLISAATAAVSAAAELVTPGGMDTITCPLCAMMVLLPMIYLTGGM